MGRSTLDELFTENLQDLYDAAKERVKGLPKMADAASSPQLQKAFQEHLEQTKGHVERLQRIFTEVLSEDPRSKRCAGIRGILEESEEAIENGGGAVEDAALIAAAQRVEHYEIAAYGSLRTWAELLDHERAAQLLQETLIEEKEADYKLTEIAVAAINREAAQATKGGNGRKIRRAG